MDSERYKCVKEQKALAMKKKEAADKKEAARRDADRLICQLKKCIGVKSKALKSKMDCMKPEEKKAMGDMMDCVMAGVKRVCLKSVMQKYCREQELKLRYERLIKDKKIEKLMKECPVKKKGDSAEGCKEPREKERCKESETLRKCIADTTKLLEAELERESKKEKEKCKDKPEVDKCNDRPKKADDAKTAKKAEESLKAKKGKNAIIDSCKGAPKDKSKEPAKKAKTCDKPKKIPKDKHAKDENKESKKEECPKKTKEKPKCSKGDAKKSPFEQRMEECEYEEWKDICKAQEKNKTDVAAIEDCLSAQIKKRCRKMVIKKMCAYSFGEPKKKNKCEAEKECGDSCVQKKWKEACPTIQDLTEKNDVDFSEASKEVKKMMKKSCEEQIAKLGARKECSTPGQLKAYGST